MAVTNAAQALDRMLDPVTRSLGPEVAQRVVDLRADEQTQERIDYLAQKCNEGQLSGEERAEYEAYVSAGTLIAILQSKARSYLRSRSA